MQGQCESKYKKLDEYFENKKPDKILLVCGNSIKKLEIGKYFDSLEENTGIQVIRFSDFTPNPTYESASASALETMMETCLSTSLRMMEAS